MPWRRAWQPLPALLPGDFPRTEEPGSYSPWGCKEPDVTERLSGSMLCYRPDFLCHCFQSFLVALHVSTCLFWRLHSIPHWTHTYPGVGPRMASSFSPPPSVRLSSAFSCRLPYWPGAFPGTGMLSPRAWLDFIWLHSYVALWWAANSAWGFL